MIILSAWMTISLRMKKYVAVDKIELQRLPNYVKRTVDLVINIFDESEADLSFLALTLLELYLRVVAFHCFTK